MRSNVAGNVLVMLSLLLIQVSDQDCKSGAIVGASGGVASNIISI